MKLPWTRRAEEAEARARAAADQRRHVELQAAAARRQIRRADEHLELNGWNKIARALIVGEGPR